MTEITPEQWFKMCLIDGTPNGMLKIEKDLWRVQVLLIPNNPETMEEFKNRPEIERTGIYILLGAIYEQTNEKNVVIPKAAYIGQSKEIGDRLQSHKRNPPKVKLKTLKEMPQFDNISYKQESDVWDFVWDRAVLITATENKLNPGHAQYLEATLIDVFKKIGKGFGLVNERSNPIAPTLAEDDLKNMNDILDNVLIILPALGIDMFHYQKRPLEQESEKSIDEKSINQKKQQEPPIFELISKDDAYAAKMKIKGSDFIVLAGSHAHSEWRGDDFGSDKETRKDLEQKKILVREEGEGKSLKFKKDYAFKSVSAAAKAVVGRNVNGTAMWRNTENSNQTYKEWYEKWKVENN